VLVLDDDKLHAAVGRVRGPVAAHAADVARRRTARNRPEYHAPDLAVTTPLAEGLRYFYASPDIDFLYELSTGAGGTAQMRSIALWDQSRNVRRMLAVDRELYFTTPAAVFRVSTTKVFAPAMVYNGLVGWSSETEPLTASLAADENFIYWTNPTGVARAPRAGE
jgi:hypothetical protein